jgi:hypothetical protein
MAQFDVFNGDADGLCALHQLRLARPAAAQLVTGVKRDVALLDRVQAAGGDRVTVLDISLATNRTALIRLLDAGAFIDYFDHHDSGVVPVHPGLTAHIDQSADVCTSLLVDAHLRGRFRIWAIVAAFGDNLTRRAAAMSIALGLDAGATAMIKSLGEALNYNAYGDSEGDLLIHPQALYRELHEYEDPLAFATENPWFERLQAARTSDLDSAWQATPLFTRDCGAVYCLPDAAWSRRVRGAFGNDLSTRWPDRAHAILTPNERGGYVVSLRAPFSAPDRASELARRFPGGGGRAASAGINDLGQEGVDDFVAAFFEFFARAG